MNAFKQQCIDLRKKDYTLPEIVRITGRPKTSVHFHIRNLALSARKRHEIGQARAKQAAEMARERYLKSARPFKIFDVWNIDLVCLIGHLIFDGEIKHSGCIYNNRSAALIHRVELCMQQIYDYNPSRYFNKETGVLRIAYYNVALGDYAKKKSQELLTRIPVMDRELKREFLRSFFDDEGCIDFRPDDNSRRIRGYQKDIRILKIIQPLLKDFKIISHIQAPNEVVISGKENLTRFQKEINFSPEIRINGNRSNSIWKEHLEKRELLARAITSYQI